MHVIIISCLSLSTPTCAAYMSTLVPLTLLVPDPTFPLSPPPPVLRLLGSSSIQVATAAAMYADDPQIHACSQSCLLGPGAQLTDGHQLSPAPVPQVQQVHFLPELECSFLILTSHVPLCLSLLCSTMHSVPRSFCYYFLNFS